ncbi:MAG: multicopper oxidase domain-containing protein [Gemmatimonadales bacterium]
MMDWLTTTAQAEWVMRDPATGHENMAIDWKFKLGDIVKIRLANDRATLHPMPHPIHMHGQRFLVLAHNDVPATNLVWKDTILVPVGAGRSTCCGRCRIRAVDDALPHRGALSRPG